MTQRSAIDHFGRYQSSLGLLEQLPSRCLEIALGLVQHSAATMSTWLRSPRPVRVLRRRGSPTTR